MNAKEARALTDKHIAEADEAQFNLIMDQIEKTAILHQSLVYFQFSIQLTTKRRLEELGYKVENGNHYNETYSNVSW